VSRFAEVLHKLWNTKGYAYSPNAFKGKVGDCNENFKGYDQHDSGEFTNWLLDAIHEDLYRAKTKPGTSAIETKGTDEVVSAEFWTNHLIRNRSFITDLFCGQYKSTLVCPLCKGVNITFDTF
jgi:ubiquitin carboxyl-terminal hydrolase 4/11/15